MISIKPSMIESENFYSKMLIEPTTTIKKRLAIAFAVAVIIVFSAILAFGKRDGKLPPVVEVKSQEAKNAAPVLAKSEVAGLIEKNAFSPNEQVVPIADENGNVLYVRTTVLPSLQARATRWVKASRAAQTALVIINPDTGEVLALAGYRNDGEDYGTALAGSFPAASLFKIVTAAAAVEAADLSADSALAYDGGKHTLYKNHLKKEADQGSNASTLKESFAESINSVFGKLGAFTLGPAELADFAGRFGFNHELGFEIPVESSTFSVGDEKDAFHLAELASGFNRQTRVSPLHGALMAAVAATGGKLPEPFIVKEVFDIENNIYYQAASSEATEAVSPATALELERLMRSTVEEGTARKTFAGAKNHPVLSKLVIGGKSGSINNEDGQRVDWFVAWAKPGQDLNGAPSLALSAVVVYDDLATTTSQRLIKDSILAYYQDYIKRQGSKNGGTRSARAN